MRTDKEIAAEALRRAEGMRRARRSRQSRLFTGLAAAACLVLVVGLSFALSAVLPAQAPADADGGLYSASLLLGSGVGGYVLVGVVGFALGVAVTLLARRLRGNKR